jgi:membrane protein implicated in regulation of membrane protease activity
MIHNVILAVSIAAAVSVLLVALWTVIGNKIDAQGGIFSGHVLSDSLSHRRGSRRHSTNIEVRTLSERALPGGWSLIHQAMRARSDIRIAVR